MFFLKDLENVSEGIAVGLVCNWLSGDCGDYIYFRVMISIRKFLVFGIVVLYIVVFLF